MDDIKGPAIALAQVAIVPQSAFSPTSKPVVERLKSLLVSLDSLSRKQPISQDVGEYVYFPIHQLLQKDELGDLQSEYLLSILTLLFRFCWKASLELDRASQLTAVVSYLVSPEAPGKLEKFRSKSQEVHAAAFSCLKAIFDACETSNVHQIGESPSIPHVVTILLASLQYDTDLATQAAALDAINAILTLISDPDKKALLLPGISSKIVNFVNNQWGVKHVSAKISALRLFARMVKECLADDLGKSSVRTDKWKNASDSQLKKVVETFYRVLIGTSHESLATALFNVAETFLECLKLSKCLDVVVDIILYCAAQTRYVTARERATAALACAAQNPIIHKALESRALTLTTDLGSKLSSHDESIPNLALDALTHSIAHTSRSLHETLLNSVETSLTLSLPKKQLLSSENILDLANFGIQSNVSESTLIHVQDMLQELGRQEGRHLGTLHTKLLSAGNLDSIQILWMASNMLAKAEVLDETYFDYLDFTLGVVSRAGSIASGENPNLVAISVFMIGRLATHMDLGPELIDILFPVVDMLGHQNTIVSYNAQLALLEIARSSGYESLTALILANKDYILDGVSNKLNTLDFSPSTPSMLSSLIRLSGLQIIPYLDDIVASLFIILDNYHGYSLLVTGIFKVLATIVQVVAESQQRLVTDKPSSRIHFDTFGDMLAELHRQPVVDPEILEAPELPPELPEPDLEADKDSDEDSIDEPMDNGEEKWSVSLEKSTYLIIDRIFGYADRFLTHSSAHLRFNLLEIVSSSVSLLALSDKFFLPQVHKLWPVLVERLTDPEVFVVESTFRCISEVCRYAGDFMRPRMETLWPTLEKRYAATASRRWPQYSNEQRHLASLAACLTTVIEFVPLTSLTYAGICRLYTSNSESFEPLAQALDVRAGDVLWAVQHE